MRGALIIFQAAILTFLAVYGAQGDSAPATACSPAPAACPR